MGITITETSKPGGRVPKAAEYVIATSPPIARGGLRPNMRYKGGAGMGKGKGCASNGNGKGKGNGNGKGKGKGRGPRRGGGGMGMGKGRHRLLSCFNAFGKLNLGLPRAVGDYTYVTTIENVTVKGSGAEQLWCFCPWQYHYSSAIGQNLGSQGMNMNTFFAWNSTANGINSNPQVELQVCNSKAIADAFERGVECVPAAMSVRVTCPTPLQNATGQFFLGKWNIACDPREYATFKAISDGFMSYGQPRPLTAARMAMRGVQVNAMPRNMGDCSDFLHTSANGGPDIQPLKPYDLTNPSAPWMGFSPIFLVVEASTDDKTSLNVQVAIKWRYRFPINNPAAKTHVYQPITHDTVWNEAMGIMSELGHGVEAIPEGVEALI